MVKDHLGNEFKTIADMVRYHGVKLQTYYNRLQRGLSLEQALTKEEIKTEVYRQQDHLGNKFKTIEDMCNYWGISKWSYFERRQSGKSVKEALTGPVKSLEATDHLGNTFKSVADLTRHYGIEYSVYRARIKAGWSKKEAIEIPSGQPRVIEWVEDDAGNRYSSIKELCDSLGIDYNTYYKAKRDNVAISSLLIEKEYLVDILGRQYKSVQKLAKAYGIDGNTLSYRIKSYWDFDIAYLIGTDKWARLKFIGLDNKAYYIVNWSKDEVTARQIIAHCRPELLEVYDQHNPTGEWKPFIRKGHDNG